MTINHQTHRNQWADHDIYFHSTGCWGNMYRTPPYFMGKNLVGGWPTPLKNMKVNGKDYPIYYGILSNSCLKPPTSILSNGFIPYIQWVYPLWINPTNQPETWLPASMFFLTKPVTASLVQVADKPRKVWAAWTYGDGKIWKRWRNVRRALYFWYSSPLTI